MVYHGDYSTVRRAISEIGRVLKKNGIFIATFLSKRNSDFGLGEKISKDTFLRTHGYDEGHPHYYTNAADVISLLKEFEVLSLQDYEHNRKNSFHWHLVAEKL